MKIGTYYYPEQWPREQWERDFDRMAQMGMQIVHMGEFAWYSMEPSAGQIQLDWLSDAVEMAAKRKMEVILCTPTCVPPVWLVDTYPEICLQSEDGTRVRHGGRRHGNPTSLRYQEATFNIVSALADRFAKHKSVVGWQIDNELSGQFDQSDSTHIAFRAWLRNKYQTIEALNQAWGNQFWNTYYTTFDQIMMPPSRDPRYQNPHHHLDASRFWSRAYADFTRQQADVLKQRNKDWFITTNFMPFAQDVNPDDFRDSLNLWSWDTYPLSGQQKTEGSEKFRMADVTGMQFVHDQMKAYNGRWALMEVQPGQINWSGYPVLPYPGTIRLWLWTAIGHGCEFITVYRYRMPRFGIEMWHDGLVNHDGVSLSPGGRQFQQVATEVKRVFTAKTAKSSKGSAANASERPQEPSVGILFDWDQLWYYTSLPQAKKWSQPELLRAWYEAAARLGLNVKICFPDQPWPEDVSVMLVPGLQMVEQKTIDRLDEFAKRGGHVLFTCRTAIMDKTGQFFEAKRAEPILKMIGASIEAYDSLPPDVYGHVDLETPENFKWTVWADLLYPEEGTRTWGTYADQFYSGTAAVTHRKYEKGTVTYCGVYTDRPLALAVMQKLAKAVGLNTQPLPEGVRVMRRDGLLVAVNYTDKVVHTPAPIGTKFLLGNAELAPAGVAVWEA